MREGPEEGESPAESTAPCQGRASPRRRAGEARQDRQEDECPCAGKDGRCPTWREKGSTPKAGSSDLRGLHGMPRHPGLPLGSSKPRRSQVLGTHLGALPAEGVHSHIPAFPANRSVLQ